MLFEEVLEELPETLLCRRLRKKLEGVLGRREAVRMESEIRLEEHREWGSEWLTRSQGSHLEGVVLVHV